MNNSLLIKSGMALTAMVVANTAFAGSVVPVSEPGTFALLTGAIAVMALLHRNKRK